MSPSQALILVETSGEDPDENIIAPQDYNVGNFLPVENLDFGTATVEFRRDPQGLEALIPKTDWIERLLPYIGAPFQTQNENQIFTEVAEQLTQIQMRRRDD